MIKIKKYPFFKQEEAKDCGAACLYMIIDYYKGHLNIESIRELLKINQMGTTAYHIIEGAKKIGFEAKGVKCNLDDINEDNIILPCIANVIINNTYKHFIVIYKIDFIKNTILIADPSNKIMTMSFDIFKSIFSGVIIILYPKEDIPCENTKNLKLKLLTYIAKSHPKLIKQVSVLSIFITIFSIISSFFLEKISNTISYYKSKEIIILVLLIFLSLNILKHLTNLFRDKLLILINEKLNLSLTLDTFKKILLLPYKSYQNKTTGDISMRIIDIGIIKDSISKIFITLIVDFPLALLAMIVLLIINVKLFLLSFIVLVLYILIILLFKEYFDDSIKLLKKDNINTTNYIIESISNFETIKGLHIIDNIYHRFEKKFVVMLKHSFKYDNMICLQNFLKGIIDESGLILIYSIGAILVINEQITFSNLLTFGSLLTYFFEPIKNLINLESTFRELDLVLNRVDELNNVPVKSGITNEVCRGSIVFKNLSYTYDDRKEVLKDINLKINSGEKVIILGSSGSGKSTLLKLLMRYYEISRNKVFINDIDINDYNEVEGISYIGQSENLFTDSLYNNLTLFQQVNANKILEVSEICEIEEILGNNQLGYNMFIEENGFNLSGGERQRIILARALLRRFNILIIDEGLNQMDVNLERKILKKLFNKYKNKTILVISHRIENLDLYNRKIVLENGVLIENITKV